MTTAELPLRELVRVDLEARTHENFRLYSDTRFWLPAIAKLVVSPVRAVLTYRVAHELTKRKGLLPLALLLRARVRTSVPSSLEQSEPKHTVIGDDVVFGTHAVILGGVTIGDGAVIGAKAVGIRDVAPYTVASALPARAV